LPALTSEESTQLDRVLKERVEASRVRRRKFERTVEALERLKELLDKE